MLGGTSAGSPVLAVHDRTGDSTAVVPKASTHHGQVAEVLTNLTSPLGRF